MRVLGINDEVTTCECCGRSELKCTVVLETTNGGMVHYGRQCAVKAIKAANGFCGLRTQRDFNWAAYARRHEYAAKVRA